MLKNEIGHNAGKIWSILDNKGEMTLKGLISESSLSENQVVMAIGWLAREGKVYLHEKKKEVLICLIS